METRKTLVNSLLITTIISVSCVATAIILKQTEPVEDVFTCKLTVTECKYKCDDPQLFACGKDDITVLRTGYYVFYANSDPKITYTDYSSLGNITHGDNGWTNQRDPIMLYKGDKFKLGSTVNVKFITPDRFVKSMYRHNY